MRYRYAIGATLGTMQYLFALKIKPPRNAFAPYAIARRTGSGQVIGQGWGRETWDWGFLTDTERAPLKTLCSGLSGEVYITTYNDSLATPAWETYRVIMLWTPEAEDRQSDTRMKFALPFRLLEKIEV